MARTKRGRRLLKAVPLVLVTGGAVFMAYRGGVAGRWHWTNGVLLQWLAVAVCLVSWVIYSIFVIPGGRADGGMRIYARLGLFVLAGVLALVACHFAWRIAGTRARAREVRPALDAGLRADCLALIANWPSKEWRIFPGDPEFQKLPASVRMLDPLYVTNDALLSGPAVGPATAPTIRPPTGPAEWFLVLNIGICKNGFGGFHMGIRVFVDEDSLPTDGGGWWFVRKRVAPNVYIWTQGT